MMTAKIFENGGSQAVRLPKEYRFDANEVSINKIGNREFDNLNRYEVHQSQIWLIFFVKS